MSLLTVDALSVSFRMPSGTVKAVREVSFAVGENEVVGILGESGCGKSVLLTALVRLLPSNALVSGKVFLGGEELLTLSERKMERLRGKKVGFVPQNPGTSLNPLLRIGSQITEAISTSLRRSHKRAQAMVSLQQFGFGEPWVIFRAYPHMLSGGMQQRVLVVAGIINQPRLVMVDEPTKGLDPSLRARVVEVFQEVARLPNTALLCVSHDYLVLQRLAHRVMVMYAGELVEIGSTKEVFHTPLHPYTVSLLWALPERGMRPIPGTSPSLSNLPSGCSFHPRCFQARSSCSVDHPSLQRISPGRWVRCPYARF